MKIGPTAPLLRCWAEIDLEAIRHNARVAAAVSQCGLIRVIKTSGYGFVREDLGGGDTVWRVLRGGSYVDSSSTLRCAFRYGPGPSLRIVSGGFRVVVSPFLPPLVSDGSDL